MSWRRWQGWEPTETTVHYDQAGNVTGRSVTTRQAEWDDDTRAWALALSEYEARICDGCGGDVTETMNPDNEYRYRVEHPERCYRCTAIGAKAEEYHKPGSDGRPASHQPQALRFPVTYLR